MVLRGEGVPGEKIDEVKAYKHQGDYTELSPPTIWLGSHYIELSTWELSAAAMELTARLC